MYSSMPPDSATGFNAGGFLMIFTFPILPGMLMLGPAAKVRVSQSQVLPIPRTDQTDRPAWSVRNIA